MHTLYYNHHEAISYCGVGRRRRAFLVRRRRVVELRVDTATARRSGNAESGYAHKHARAPLCAPFRGQSAHAGKREL